MQIFINIRAAHAHTDTHGYMYVFVSMYELAVAKGVESVLNVNSKFVAINLQL